MTLDTIVTLEKRAIDIQNEFMDRIEDYKERCNGNDDYIMFLKKRYKETQTRFRELSTICEMLCGNDTFARDRLTCTIYENRLSAREMYKDFIILFAE